MKYFVAHDKFGPSVGLNDAGKSSYQTKVGAFLSLISSTLVLFYAVTRRESLITRRSPAKSSQLSYINRIGHEGEDIQEGNSGLAISLWDGAKLFDEDKTNDLDYVSEAIPSQVSYFEVVENFRTFEKGWHYKTVPNALEKCSFEKHFKYYIKSEESRNLEEYIENSLCLNTENLRV